MTISPCINIGRKLWYSPRLRGPLKNVLVLLWLILMVGCASVPVPSAEQLAALQEARNLEYQKNAAAASTVTEKCNEDLGNKEASELTRLVKNLLDTSCELEIQQMSIILQVWNLGITQSVYFKNTTPSLVIAKYQLEVTQRGLNLVSEANYDCITQGMQSAKAFESQPIMGFGELLDYYALYSQIHSLVNNPSGSY